MSVATNSMTNHTTDEAKAMIKEAAAKTKKPTAKKTATKKSAGKKATAKKSTKANGKTKTAKAPKAEKQSTQPANKAKAGTGIGAYAMDLLSKEPDVDVVLAAVLKKFPDSACKKTSIYWYRSEMRRANA